MKEIKGIELEDIKKRPEKEDYRRDVEELGKIKVKVSAILGSKHLTVEDFKKIKEGDLIEIDRESGHNVDVFVSNKKIALGEIIVMDNQFGLEISEVVDEEKEFLKEIRRK